MLNIADALHSPVVENINLISGRYGDFLNSTLETVEAPENQVVRSMEFSSSDADMTSHNVTSNESTICHGSDLFSDVSDPLSAMHPYMNVDDACFADSPMHPLSASQLSMAYLFEGEGNGHVLPACGNFSYIANDGFFNDKGSVQPFNRSQPPISNQEFMVKDAHQYHQDINLNVSSQSFIGGGHLNLKSSEQNFSSTRPITSTKMHLGCFGDERERKLIPLRSTSLSKVSTESIHSNSSDCKSHVDDDPDICILEDISQPAKSNKQMVLVKKTSTFPNATFCNPLLNSGIGGVRPKGNDERLIFQVALQVSAVYLELHYFLFYRLWISTVLALLLTY